MDRTIITLHEYRLHYPDSAEIPTLTQSGLLGTLLERQRQKAAKLAQLRAMWRNRIRRWDSGIRNISRD